MKVIQHQKMRHLKNRVQKICQIITPDNITRTGGLEIQTGMFSEILQYTGLNPERCKLVRHSASNTKLKKYWNNP